MVNQLSTDDRFNKGNKKVCCEDSINQAQSAHAHEQRSHLVTLVRILRFL